MNISHDKNNKKCFIYDPLNNKAFFDKTPHHTDTFISRKNTGIKLYYRKSHSSIDVIPTIHSNYDIPLLKSNLQKAIRRGNHSVAIQTALAILQKDPMQLLHRPKRKMRQTNLKI